MKTSYKILICGLLACAAFWGGYYLAPEKEKIVSEIQYRDRVRTIIEERPDGSKKTIIDQDSTRKESTEIEKTVKKIDTWSITVLASSQSLSSRGEGIYGLAVQHRLIGGLSGGLYGRTDGEVGLVLSWSF